MGMRYDRDDWRVAVVWYGRVGDDEERLIFRAPLEGLEEGGVDFFNSTELRHVLPESDVPKTMGADGKTCTWRLSRKAEAEGDRHAACISWTLNCTERSSSSEKLNAG